MPPITILKSELVAMEKKIKDQGNLLRDMRVIMQEHQEHLKRVVDMLTQAGLLPATAAEQKRSEV